MSGKSARRHSPKHDSYVRATFGVDPRKYHPEDDGSVQMEAEPVAGNAGQFNVQLIETAHNVANRARINAIEFATQVESACEAFQAFATPKVKELESGVTLEDLADSLTATVIDKVGGALLAKVTNEIGKVIADKMAGLLKDKLKKATSLKGNSPKELEAAIQLIVQGARDSATGMIDAVTANIDAPADEIIEAVNRGAKLTSKQEDFIAPFYGAATGSIDATLEGYGIPSGAAAKALNLQIYHDLVKKFEEKLIWADATFRDKLEMGFARDFGATEKTLAYKAEQAATAETKLREQAMAGAGRP